MQTIVGEESSIKRAGITSYENRWTPRLFFFSKLLIEFWQGLKDRVEVICWKIVKVHSKFWWWLQDIAASPFHSFNNVFDYGQGIGSRRAAQISYAKALWSSYKKNFLYCFCGYVLHNIRSLLLSTRSIEKTIREEWYKIK